MKCIACVLRARIARVLLIRYIVVTFHGPVGHGNGIKICRFSLLLKRVVVVSSSSSSCKQRESMHRFRTRVQRSCIAHPVYTYTWKTLLFILMYSNRFILPPILRYFTSFAGSIIHSLSLSLSPFLDVCDKRIAVIYAHAHKYATCTWWDRWDSMNISDTEIIQSDIFIRNFVNFWGKDTRAYMRIEAISG